MNKEDIIGKYNNGDYIKFKNDNRQYQIGSQDREGLPVLISGAVPVISEIEIIIPFNPEKWISKLSEQKDQALRFNSEKPPLEELDPYFIEEMGKLILKNRIKYPNQPDGKPNWHKTAGFSQYLGCILRHTLKLMKGEDIDEESGFNHAIHISFNCMMLFYTMRNRPDREDRIYKDIK